MLATKVESRTTHDNVFNALPGGVVNFTAEAIKATSSESWPDRILALGGVSIEMSPNESQGENMLMPKGQPCQKTSKVVEASVRRQKEVMYLHLEYESVVKCGLSFAFICGGKGALCVQLWTSLDPRWLTQDTPQVSSLLNRESLYPGKEEQPEHMAAACEQTAVFSETSANCQILISFQILLAFHR